MEVASFSVHPGGSIQFCERRNYPGAATAAHSREQSSVRI